MWTYFSNKRCGIFTVNQVNARYTLERLGWKKESFISYGCNTFETSGCFCQAQCYHSYNSSSWYIVIRKQSGSATQNICDFFLSTLHFFKVLTFFFFLHGSYSSIASHTFKANTSPNIPTALRQVYDSKHGMKVATMHQSAEPKRKTCLVLIVH